MANASDLREFIGWMHNDGEWIRGRQDGDDRIDGGNACRYGPQHKTQQYISAHRRVLEYPSMKYAAWCTGTLIFVLIVLNISSLCKVEEESSAEYIATMQGGGRKRRGASLTDGNGADGDIGSAVSLNISVSVH